MNLLDAATPQGAAHQAWLHEESVRLLGWAEGAALPNGGFGYRDRSGDLDPDRGMPLWIGCRMVHCLSLGAAMGRTKDAELATAGVAALRTIYRDTEHGGWWSNAAEPGQGRKEAYGHAFVILAGASATVAGIPGGRELLDDACDTFLEHFWDTSDLMPFESYALDWSDLEEYRGGNASMHTVEAFLAAADATGDELWRERALAISLRIVGNARRFDWRIPEHYSPTWEVVADYNRDQPRHQFRPFGATPGHAFEWSRLLLTLRAAHHGTDELLAAACELTKRAWTDAWDPELGGLVYTTDMDGKPVVRERLHWVACEAAGAAWALWRASGKEQWAQMYDTIVAFNQAHFIDPLTPGAWQHELTDSNTPTELTWPGAPDVYHALQAVLLPPLPLAPGLAAALVREYES